MSQHSLAHKSASPRPRAAPEPSADHRSGRGSGKGTSGPRRKGCPGDDGTRRRRLGEEPLERGRARRAPAQGARERAVAGAGVRDSGGDRPQPARDRARGAEQARRAAQQHDLPSGPDHGRPRLRPAVAGDQALPDRPAAVHARGGLAGRDRAREPGDADPGGPERRDGRERPFRGSLRRFRGGHRQDLRRRGVPAHRPGGRGAPGARHRARQGAARGADPGAA